MVAFFKNEKIEAQRYRNVSKLAECPKWSKKQSPILYSLGLPSPDGTSGKKKKKKKKNLPPNKRDVRDIPSIHGLRRSSGGESGDLLLYPCLENPMDRGAWPVIVHGVAKSWT